MSQKEYQNISDFINGTLNEDKRNVISKHIKSYSTTGEKDEMKTDNKKIFDPEKAWANFHKRIENDDLKTHKSKAFFSLRNIAASFVILLGLSIFGYLLINNFSQSQFTEISSMNNIKDVTLPDGSQITLNLNSKIKFPEKFSETNRSVEFSGEAFFDITENPSKPFIIQTNKAEITVLGTSFNVLTDKKDNITVTVKTGKVQLSNNKKENITLIPKEVGKIENNTLSKSINIDKNYLSWKTKCFTYNGEQLSKVIEDFNEVYHVNIILKDKEIGSLPIVTSPQNKTIDVALNLICTPHNLEFKEENNSIIISKKVN